MTEERTGCKSRFVIWKGIIKMTEYKRISKYYNGVDGVKLAVDVYLPDTAEKAPAIMYVGRSMRRDRFEEQKSILTKLLSHGYAVVLPDLRGIGASFGRTDGFHDRRDAQDMKTLMETLVMEEWSDGNFGMLGGSNNGFIQDLTAAENPAPLRAVIPCDCHPDFYYQDYPNGASRHINFVGGAGPEPVHGTPVDEDTDGSLLELAEKDHASNLGFLGQYMENMHRDTINPKLGTAPQREISIWERTDSIAYSDIKYYKNGAWYDPGAAGAIYAYKLFDGKLLIGPWRHCEIYHCNEPDPTPEEQTPFRMPIGLPNAGFPWEDEYIRFFDAAIRGVENGCFTEPQVRYYTRGDETGKEWKYAADLPLDDQKIVSLHLGTEKSGTIDSCFDGTLTETKKANAEDKIPYELNRNIRLFGVSGTLNRRIEGRFADEAKKCLTFTTDVFEAPAEITGIPELDIEVTSDYKDGLFLAVLEEVYADGTTCFLSDGAMRASHAKLGHHTAYLSMGMPYHPGLTSDLAELDPEKRLLLEFTMESISQVIQKGSRLRLSIFCAEKMYQQPECIGESGLSHIALYPGRSVLKLPVISSHVSEFEGEISVGSEKGNGKAYVFKRAIFVYLNEKWYRYPCTQIYPLDNKTTLYCTEKFNVTKRTEEAQVTVLAEGNVNFSLSGILPVRKEFADSRPWLHPHRSYTPTYSKYPTTFKDQWVATVPVQKCQQGFPDAGPYHTMDLLLNLKLPPKGSAPFPCIVGIHGHGGDYDCFERLTDQMLEAGFAVASVDYRATPPNRWPSLLYDVKGAIRYLKASADRYGLDAERFGIMGGSCGGHLSAFLAATNGEPSSEGNIGGNTEFNSKIKAAAIYFPWTDALTFGEDIYHQYPGQMNKVMNSDGPFAPPGYMFDFGGEGKGLGILKAHLTDPEYRDAVDRAIDISPVSHVTKDSAPSVIIHGIFECGIQIPMNQSVRFFEELTRKGVKSLLLCNNNEFFGDDPEVQTAVVDFLKRRV